MNPWEDPYTKFSLVCTGAAFFCRDALCAYPAAPVTTNTPGLKREEVSWRPLN